MDRNLWAVKLGEVLTIWLEKNGYQYATHLADELIISRSTLGRITRGDAIANETEVYAKLFLKTKLREADPRAVPPRIGPLPRGGTTTIKRAWSEKEYQAWLAKQDTPVDDNEGEPSFPESSRPRDTETIGSFRLEPRQTSGTVTLGDKVGREIGQKIDEYLDLAADDFAERVSQRLNMGSTNRRQHWTITELAIELYNQLQEIIQLDSPAEREKRLSGGVRAALMGLKKPIGILSSSAEEREETIREERAMGL